MTFLNNPFIGQFIWQSEVAKFKWLNYNWEDDAAFYDKGSKWECPYFPGKLNVYDFHPIRIHLNSKDGNPYSALKKSINTSLSNISEKQITKFVNPNYGTPTFLKGDDVIRC